jgi:hypothetical protein
MASNNEEVMHLINQARAEARRENFNSIFVKNSKLIIALILLSIFFLGAFFAVTNYQDNKKEKFSKQLHQALIYQEKGDIEKTKETLENIYNSNSAPNGVKSIASLRLAAILMQSDQKLEALKIYQNINNNGNYDQYIRELAGLLEVKTLVVIDDKSKEKETLATINKIESKSSLLKYYISEQKGILAMKQNDFETAKKIFEEISKNPESSESLKQRSGEMLKIVTSK